MRMYIDVETGSIGNANDIRFLDLTLEQVQEMGEMNDNNRINAFYDHLREATSRIEGS